MILLKSIVKLIRLLNSETSANSIAIALALGMFLGLVPLLTLQALLVALVVMFFRVNVSACLLAMAAFWPLHVLLREPLDAAGVALLESTPLEGLWTSLYNSPLHWIGTHDAVTLASTLLALALLAPVYLLGRLGVLLYRTRFGQWWIGLPFINALRASRLYRLYLSLDSPFGE
jgi:uncharacterized protein (TIGR03546 family)